MIAVDLYPWFTLFSSLAILGLFAAHAYDAHCRYRCHHDDRAAVDLLIALTLAVASVGLTVGAAARFVPDHGTQAPIGNVGLCVVRGALFTAASVLFLMDRRVLESAR